MSSLLINKSHLSKCRTGPGLQHRLHFLPLPSAGINPTPLSRFKRIIITTPVCI